MNQRLGTGFHETFRLDRARLSEVLRAARSHEDADTSNKGFSAKDLSAAETSLGTNMRRSFPRWGFGVGMLQTVGSRYRLSALGDSALGNDPTLHQPDTQWLMHYHLSAPNGPGPAFWHRLFAEAFRMRDTFGREEVERAILSAQQAPVGDKLIRSTATILLGTYTDSAGLGGLHVIRPALNERGRYELNLIPRPPTTWTFAYALVDHWERVWDGQLTVGLERLFEPGGLANLLFLDRSRVDDCLSFLQRKGWIEVFRVAPPFQLVRRWSDPSEKMTEALNHVYADDPE